MTTVIALLLAGAFHASARAQETGQEEGPGEPEVSWQKGPGKAELGALAELQLPADYLFAGSDDTRRLMERMGNPTSGRELGFVSPGAKGWFAVFEFSETGFVKDDEKDSLDAAAILESIKRGNERANDERRKRGWDVLDVVGWDVPPTYNNDTHNLEWAVRCRDPKGGEVVNYNVRILGRTGVMEATLVTDPEKLQAQLVPFRALLGGYSYRSGSKYSEYRSGDKIAAYGLTALVAGGAAAVAAKSGVFSKFFKVILVALVAFGAFLKSLFNKLLGRKAAPPPAETKPKDGGSGTDEGEAIPPPPAE